MEVHQGRGAKVRQREAWDTRNPHVLRACIERGPDPETLRLAIEARARASRWRRRSGPSTSAGDDDFRLLASRIDRDGASARRATRPTRRTRSSRAEEWFHRTLMLLSDNELLAKLTEQWHGAARGAPARPRAGPRRGRDPSPPAHRGRASRPGTRSSRRTRSSPTETDWRGGSAAAAEPAATTPAPAEGDGAGEQPCRSRRRSARGADRRRRPRTGRSRRARPRSRRLSRRAASPRPPRPRSRRRGPRRRARRPASRARP